MDVKEPRLPDHEPFVTPESMAAPLSSSIVNPEEGNEDVESLGSAGSDLEKHPPINEKSSAPGSNGSDVEKQPQTDEKPLQRPGMGPRTESEYPPTSQLIVVMAALMMSIFLIALDRTIIATAIPKITDDFHSIDDIGWYGSAFMLTSCSFQLLLGRIYTFYSPKYTFLISIFIFEVGSALCGAAPNSIAFIIGRAIAGIGSAGIMSGAIILLVATIPLAKRPIYMGFFGAVFGVASVVGPLLGGVFTSDVTWRWCFYINLPVGGAAMVIILFILKPTPPTQPNLSLRQQIAKLDLLGELCLFPCIICLLLALQWGGSTYAWSDGRIIALFVVFAVLLIGFVLVQVFMQQTSTIPASVFWNRSIIAAMWLTLCIASTMMALVYFIPIWFQAIEGVSAVESGIRTLPLVLALVLGSIMAGQIVGRIGYYAPLAILSAVVMPIGAGMITTWNVHTGEGQWIGYQILLGFGIGVGMQQGSMAAQTVLDKKDVSIGVSLMFFMQMLGGAIFISVGQNVFDTKLVSGLVELVPGLSPSDVVNTGATDLRGIIPAEHLPEVLVVYNAAIRQVFLVGVAMASLSVIGALGLEWRSVKKGQGRGGAKGAKEDEGVEAKTEGQLEQKV